MTSPGLSRSWTMAVSPRRGERYVVNGNKCWNSKAHKVSHHWLLARTGEQADRGGIGGQQVVGVCGQ